MPEKSQTIGEFTFLPTNPDFADVSDTRQRSVPDFSDYEFGFSPIGGEKIGELGVTKLRIADCGTCGTAGTCGTYIYIFFQKKPKEVIY